MSGPALNRFVNARPLQQERDVSEMSKYLNRKVAFEKNLKTDKICDTELNGGTCRTSLQSLLLSYSCFETIYVVLACASFVMRSEAMTSVRLGHLWNVCKVLCN